MKHHKRDFIPFSFYDRTGMAAHLEKRAAEGWLLDKVTPFGWHYRRIEPAKLHFTVTYDHRLSEFAPGPTEEEQTYQDFCAHGGWHFAAAAGKMYFFYSAEEDPLPIETDPALELKQMARATRIMVVLLWVWLLLGFWMGGSFCWSLVNRPVDLLSNSLNLFTGLAWLGLFVYSAADLWTYYRWRYRARKAAALGEFVPTRGHHKLLLGVAALVVLGLLYWLLTERCSGMQALMAAQVGIIAVLMLAVQGTKNFLKRRGTPTEVNRVVTLGVDVLLALALWGVLTAMLLSGVRSGAFSSESGVEPPLQMQALTGVEGKYVTNTRLEETVFLSKLEVSQYVRWQEGEILPGLEYTLVEVKCPPFYDLCVDEMLKEYEDWSFDEPEFRYVYEPCDPAPWGAEKAYQLTLGGEARDCYLLCWPDRLVSLKLDFTPTAEQMALAGERLQAG